MKRIAIGIDTGLTGSIAVMDIDEKSFTFIDFKSDQVRALELLKHYKETANIVSAYVEEVHALGGSSAKATFGFGRNYGRAGLLFELAEIELVGCQPKEWQKFYRFTIPKGLTPYRRRQAIKKTICKIAIAKYPQIRTEVITPRNAIKDGRTDAILIMHYGLSKFKTINTKEKSMKTVTTTEDLLEVLKAAKKDATIVIFQPQVAAATTTAGGSQAKGELLTRSGHPIMVGGEIDFDLLCAEAKAIGLTFRSDIKATTLEARYRKELVVWKQAKLAKGEDSNEEEEPDPEPPFDTDEDGGKKGKTDKKGKKDKTDKKKDKKKGKKVKSEPKEEEKPRKERKSKKVKKDKKDKKKGKKEAF